MLSLTLHNQSAFTSDFRITGRQTIASQWGPCWSPLHTQWDTTWLPGDAPLTLNPRPCFARIKLRFCREQRVWLVSQAASRYSLLSFKIKLAFLNVSVLIDLESQIIGTHCPKPPTYAKAPWGPAQSLDSGSPILGSVDPHTSADRLLHKKGQWVKGHGSFCFDFPLFALSSIFNIKTSLLIVTENAGHTHVHITESDCTGLPFP